MPGRKLHVEMNDILEALTRSGDDPASYFLDLQQGGVVAWDAQLDLDHDDEIANALEAEPSRYVPIPRSESRARQQDGLVAEAESWLEQLGIDPSFQLRPRPVSSIPGTPARAAHSGTGHSGTGAANGKASADLADRALAQLTLGEVIGAVAAAGVAPGAGAAGAIALALAAACAAKAVAITLRRGPPDDHLVALLDQLTAISQRALSGADEDARRFEQFSHSQDAADASRLIRSGEALQQLASSLQRSLRGVVDRIDPLVRGDVLAAGALCDAFRAIQSENLSENRQAAASLDRQ